MSAPTGIKLSGSFTIDGPLKIGSFGTTPAPGQTFTVTQSMVSNPGSWSPSNISGLGPNGDEGFVIVYSQPCWEAPYFFTSTGGSTQQIQALFASLPNTGSGQSYLFNVTWADNSTGVAKVGWSDYNSLIYMVSIDTNDTTTNGDWTEANSTGMDKLGTFAFPATFTLYSPTTFKGGWC